MLGIEECIAAVEQAFKLYAEGETVPPGILGLHAQNGGSHIKAGLLELSRSYFAAKVNANFPQNKKQFGSSVSVYRVKEQKWYQTWFDTDQIAHRSHRRIKNGEMVRNGQESLRTLRDCDIDGWT